MREMDHILSKRLMTLCRGINQLKLDNRCQECEDILEDMRSDMVKLQGIHDVSDIVDAAVNRTPFRHIGLTRMNIGSRRFSTC